MPVLIQEPTRHGHPHLLALRPERVGTASARMISATDGQAWRGRKRSRSPSTSPSGSPERTWRPWTGAKMQQTAKEGDVECVDWKRVMHQEQPLGIREEVYAVPSGVHLVVPADESAEATRSEWNHHDLERNSGILGIHHPTSRIDQVSAVSRLALTPFHPSEGRITSIAPNAKRSRLGELYDPDGLEPDAFRGSDDGGRTDTQIPLWDVQRTGPDAIRASEEQMGEPSTRTIRPCDVLEAVQEFQEGQDPSVQNDIENTHYVLPNAFLNDLHIQRRASRSFTRSQAHETSHHHKAPRQPSRTALAPPASPTRSVASTTSSIRSRDHYAEASLLVASDAGCGIIGDDHSSSNLRGDGNGSPLQRRRADSWDSDANDEDGALGTGAGGPTRREQMDGVYPSSTVCVSGYEDMNRLLGRLVIQRRGCRRA